MYQEIIKAGNPAMIFFWKTWNTQCDMTYLLEGWSNESKYEDIGFYKADTSAKPEIAQKAGVEICRLSWPIELARGMVK